MATTAAGLSPDPKILEDLVTGNRILSGLGVVDGFGHLSASDGGRGGQRLVGQRRRGR